MVNNMKLLTIGNSFSQNSTKYLPMICEEAGVPLTIGRCVIGGCSLERHWNNARDDAPAYNAGGYGEGVTMKQMLEADEWDVVTMQQASHFSWRNLTFYPYFDNLVEYVHTYAPKAEIVIQQTWAYRTDNDRLNKEYFITQENMFQLLKQNYDEAAGKIGARILPVGEAYRLFQLMTGDTVGELTRRPDGPSHANELGELIGAMIWANILCGIDVDSMNFKPEEVDEKYMPLAKAAAKAAIAQYNK